MGGEGGGGIKQTKVCSRFFFVEHINPDVEPNKFSDEFKGYAAAVAEEESALVSFHSGTSEDSEHEEEEEEKHKKIGKNGQAAIRRERKGFVAADAEEDSAFVSLSSGTFEDSDDAEEEEEKRHKKSVMKVQKAIRRERERAGGYVGYWNVFNSTRKAEKVKPRTQSCSRVLQHSGLVLQDLTDSVTGDSATSKMCGGMDVGKNGSETPIGCHAINAMLLEYVAWTLPKFNITWYVEAGTLLGAVREGGFINHETDTDVVVYLASKEDYHNVGLWANQVVEDGLEANNISGWSPMAGHSFGIRTWEHGAHLDLYFVRPRDGDIWFEPGVPHWEKSWAREGVIFPLQFSCNIHGFLLPCPFDAQQYLSTLYPGSNLLVPEHRWCQSKHEKQHETQTWKNETSSNKFQAAPCQEEVPMEDLKKGIAASMKCLASSGNAFLFQR